MSAESAAAAVRRRVAPATVLRVAGLGVFLAFLDNTIVSIAFPSMLTSFPDATLGSLSWVFNVYNIALAALLVPAGRMADIFGRRRVFAGGIVLFTVASILCALAPSVGVLVAARALQGAGAATIIPSSLGLILHAYPDERRGQAIALWSATGALAAGIGPSIGGFLVGVSDWRLVFLINLPIGLVVWRLTGTHLVENRAPGRRALPDMMGALLLAITVGLVSFGIVQTEPWGWIDLRTIGVFLLAAATGAWFARRSKTHPAPIIEPELVRSRSFVVASALTIIGSAGFFALGLANVLYLMEVWNYSALTAGLAGTPAPFVAALSAAAAGRFSTGRDPRLLIFVGGVVWAIGPLMLAAGFQLQPDYLTGYLPAAVVLAVGIGVTFPLVGSIAVAGAPGGRFAGATALNSAIRQVGAAIGVAILVTLVSDPTPAETKGAFQRAWFFAAVCFALVALGSLLLGRISADADALLEDPDIVPAVVPEPAPPRRALAPQQRPADASGARAPQTIAGLLGQVELFASLDESTRSAVGAGATTVTVAAGEWLFRQGDDADALYVVQGGRLEIVDESPDRPAAVVRELAAGSALGELALICESTRTASVRARRDATLIRVGREDFDRLTHQSAEFSRELLRTVGTWLSTGRSGAAHAQTAPATIAVVAFDAEAGAADVYAGLHARIAEHAIVGVVERRTLVGDGEVGPALSEALDQAEQRSEHVLLDAGILASADDWTRACVRQADRVVLVVARSQRGADLSILPPEVDMVLLGTPGAPEIAELLAKLQPRTTYRVRGGADREGDVARVARRLAGRSVGLVLSGGGARGFCHVGVIEALEEAGVVVDRVAGTSMGAFVGALLAQGCSAQEIDERCYEEWVRRNPVGDFGLPRASLIRGERARAMLERNLPGSIEDLVLGFSAVSVDLIRAEPVRHRLGPLAIAVGASMALPVFAPPVVHEGRLLVDGGLMDNLPTEALARDGEGPIIASDVSEPSVRSLPDGVDPAMPSLPETLFKVVMLSEADDARRRSFADVLIRPDFEGVGILEFHMLDRMREAGRRAAHRALAQAPASLFGATASRR